VRTSTDGLDPHVLMDALLGTDETVDEWRDLLLSWPLIGHRVRRYDDGRMEYLGREDPDVHPRLDLVDDLRAAMSVRAALGDVDEARHVLLQLADLLAELGSEASEKKSSPTPKATTTKADTK